ncbi:hypothetical protein D3C81_1875860 [compost metagenome]
MDDLDYFSLKTQGQKVSILVEPILGYSDLSIVLFDSEKKAILEIDDNGMNQGEELSMNLKYGKYYLLINNKLKSDEVVYSINGSW